MTKDHKLQCVLNAAARLVTGTRKFDHGLSHLLHKEVHWLDVPERIHYKLGVTVHRCLQYKARVPGRLLYTSLRHSQPTSFTVSYSTSPDRTTLPAQHFRSSGLLCCRSDGLQLATGQSPWPGVQQQQFQTIAEDESVSSLPLSTHSAVEMLHDSALYKSVIDVDTDIHWHCNTNLTRNYRSSNQNSCFVRIAFNIFKLFHVQSK